MAIPNIKLTSLEYDDIYKQIVSYISTKSEFTDYNFEGSALSTIVDLLAYNTFYQIVFQNILVNEMFIDSSQKLESIISHAKLQGYTVPSRQSSFSTLRLRGAGDNGAVAAYSRIQGSRANGDVKLFYTIDPAYLESIDGVIEATFTVYEAKNAIIKQLIPPNSTKQSAFITQVNLDIKTLKVEVDLEGSGVFVEYRLATSVEPNITTSDNVFFLERKLDGYDVMFGGLTDPLTGRIIASAINDNTKIRVSYLIPSGIAGDGYNSFSFVGTPTAPTGYDQISISNSTSLVATTGVSKNGKNQPNLDALKFFVPRYFSSQDRAITKSDMQSILVGAGYASASEDIVIVGGEELSIPTLGTVYFEIVGVAATEQTAISATKLLQQKASLGISITYGVPI